MPSEILKNVYRIPIILPNSPLRAVNTYLVWGNDRNLLIDTGFNHPDCKAAMLSALAQFGVDMAKTDILLTHAHADHCGLAPEIAALGTNVYVSRADLPRMVGSSRTALWAADIKAMLRAGFPKAKASDPRTFSTSWAMAPDPSFDCYKPIDEGDLFPCGDYVLKAIATPGHTHGQMCFWMEKEKVMFTADHVLFDITPNITAFADVEDSLGDYLESLKKIDRYDVHFALPGHRESGDFHTRIKELLSHHEKRLEECYGVVKANPGSTAYALTSKMSWNVRVKSWDAFPENQKWFAVGECLSHLQHLEKIGRIQSEIYREVCQYRIR